MPLIDDFDAGATLWVLSDLHANAHALEAALERIPREDPIVVLGDLFTYGCEPARLAALVRERARAVVRGNHDELYLELWRGDRSYYEGLPDWLRESADWTLERIEPAWLEGEERIVLGDVLLAHANPYAFKDWTYLNTRAQHRAAMDALEQRIGVFGHTHRAKLYADDDTFVEGPIDARILDRRTILNTGSLGQPRDQARSSTMLSLRRTAQGIEAQHHVVRYDVRAHLETIAREKFSEATKARLAGFFGA